MEAPCVSRITRHTQGGVRRTRGGASALFVQRFQRGIMACPRDCARAVVRSGRGRMLPMLFALLRGVTR